MEFKNTSIKIEHFLKSFSSRKRIDILKLLYKKENLSLEEISKLVDIKTQNASLHTFKLLNAGLIAKQQNGLKVSHILTKRGKNIIEFIIKVDKIL